MPTMTNVTPGFFVDSNVLIYAFDADADAKRERALSVIESLTVSGLGVLSAQVLNEVFSTLTRKKRFALPQATVAQVVEGYSQIWRVVDVTAATVIDAMRGAIDHQLSYDDALIWAAARLDGLTTILSEDGQHDRVVEGVRYLNPFAPDFDVALLS